MSEVLEGVLSEAQLDEIAADLGIESDALRKHPFFRVLKGRVLLTYPLKVIEVADIADGVWDELTAGHVGAGGFGKLLADLPIVTAEFGSQLLAAAADYDFDFNGVATLFYPAGADGVMHFEIDLGGWRDTGQTMATGEALLGVTIVDAKTRVRRVGGTGTAPIEWMGWSLG